MIAASRRNHRRMGAAVLGALAAGSLIATASAPAQTRLLTAPASMRATCHYVRGHGPKGDRNAKISNVAAEAMSCTDALKLIFDGRFTKQGFVTPEFRCNTTHSGSGGTVSCKASRGYGGHGRFQFGWTA